MQEELKTLEIQLKQTVKVLHVTIEFLDSFEGRGPAHPESPDGGGEAGFPLIVLMLKAEGQEKRVELNQHYENGEKTDFAGLEFELLELSAFKTTERWGGKEPGATRVRLKVSKQP
ncbi:MAG: hypothetical protein HRT45_02635 [Bdellovibrionales bacterium]|nr:hypothetical protein [Bdellovibrionales bacterium]